jgi:hypothetical protein
MTTKRTLEEVTDIPALRLTLSLPLPKKTKITKQLLDARELEIIPQISDTCWFNVILTVLTYSQYTRKILYEEAIEWLDNLEELKRNRFKRFLIYMLKYSYTNPKKIEELFEAKIKPELLLMSFINYYNLPTFKKDIKENIQKNIRFFPYYKETISIVFRQLFANPTSIMTINYEKNNCYTQTEFLSEHMHTPPKILICFLKNVYISKDRISVISDNTPFTNITSYVNGGFNYEDEIIFNGHKYRLDACLVTNYNRIEGVVNHVICGITYDNKGYVYNGWIDNNDIYTVATFIKNKRKSKCKLFPRDWKNDLKKTPFTAGFCLPVNNCNELSRIDKSRLCFDFSENLNDKNLVYVLVDDTIVTKPLQTLLNQEDIVFTSKSVSPLIENFYEFEKKTASQLQKILKLYYNENLAFLVEHLRVYRIFYYLLVNERLTEDLIENKKEEALKKIFIKLIKIYIQDDKLFKLQLVADTNMINVLTKEQIKELAISIGYKEEVINELTKEIIAEKYKILFYSLNNSSKEYSSYSFMINLIVFYMANGLLFNLPNYNDKIIITKMRKLKIEDLKKIIEFDQEPRELNNFIKDFTKESDYGALMGKMTFVKIKNDFVKSNKILGEIYVLLIEMLGFTNSFKILLMLIIIQQQTNMELFRFGEKPLSLSRT